MVGVTVSMATGMHSHEYSWYVMYCGILWYTVVYCGILWYTLSPLVDASHVLVYVLDVVLRRKELVEVVDGSQQLLTQKSLTLAMLSFLRRKEGEYVACKVVCCA